MPVPLEKEKSENDDRIQWIPKAVPTSVVSKPSMPCAICAPDIPKIQRRRLALATIRGQRSSTVQQWL